MTARDDIEAVAGGVLGGHGYVAHWSSDADDGWTACTMKDCDWRTAMGDFGNVAAHRAHVAAVLAEALTANTIERLTHVLGCHPGTRENDGTPCASGLHSPALWGADGCTWVAEVAERLGELS